MNEKQRFDLIMKIVDRAEEMGLIALDRLTLSIDLEFADNKFDLRLDDLLNADNFNFSHDIVGIQNNIDRWNEKMDETFVPRFAGF